MALAILMMFSSCSKDEPLPKGVLFEEPYLELGCTAQQVMTNAKGSFMYHYVGGEKNWISFNNHNVEYHYIIGGDKADSLICVDVYVPQSVASMQEVYDYMYDCYVKKEIKENGYGHNTTTFSIPESGIYVDFIVQHTESSYIHYYKKS